MQRDGVALVQGAARRGCTASTVPAGCGSCTSTSRYSRPALLERVRAGEEVGADDAGTVVSGGVVTTRNASTPAAASAIVTGAATSHATCGKRHRRVVEALPAFVGAGSGAGMATAAAAAGAAEPAAVRSALAARRLAARAGAP